jgi:hypothetical protein
MKTKEQELIEKQRKLINVLTAIYVISNKECPTLDDDMIEDILKDRLEVLEFEIASLEAEIAKEKDEPKMTAEEMLSKYKLYEWFKLYPGLMKSITDAMEEYANQFKH